MHPNIYQWECSEERGLVFGFIIDFWGSLLCSITQKSTLRLEEYIFLFTIKEMKLIKDHIEKLSLICLDHKVDKLYAFGSIVGPEFDVKNSDLDFLVSMMEIPPLEKGELLLSLWDELENLFNRRVDLLSINSISNPYLQKSIDASKVLIYDRSSQKVFS